MTNIKKIESALISVFSKEGAEPIIHKLHSLGVKLYSTGGTADFIESIGVDCVRIESVTGYPSILGGRVKTLHPKVFGGILYRRDNVGDIEQIEHYEIPSMDLVMVDLYPFENTVASTDNEDEIIEKIDIGGISLIRAAAKNFADVVIIPSANQYGELKDMLDEQNGNSTIEDRKYFAAQAFNVSSHYDAAIFSYFNSFFGIPTFKKSISNPNALRYGENPHQQAFFHGNIDEVFEKLHGKDISYNNMLDIDAAIALIADFNEPTFAILKHNNACGLASRDNIKQAWIDALAGDPISAFGGVLIANREIDIDAAEEINKLFFEIIIAPSYTETALEVLRSKKNRIILVLKSADFAKTQFRTLLNGVIEQEKDTIVETVSNLTVITDNKPTMEQIDDLLFANKIVKHSKSNAIVLAKNRQLIASGVGQTSRVDALKHAIQKSKDFEFDLKGAVMASDAFFPFPDCVELAKKEGVVAVIQPGGSINDKLSIEYCNNNGVAMVTTGIRHFKH